MVVIAYLEGEGNVLGMKAQADAVEVRLYDHDGGSRPLAPHVAALLQTMAGRLRLASELQA